MIYGRKLLDKDGFRIYLEAETNCFYYHTPCTLVMETGGREYEIGRGDAVLFKNSLKPFIEHNSSVLSNGCLAFASEIYSTEINIENGIMHMRITDKNDAAMIKEFEVTFDELYRFYQAVDLRWHNRTLPLLRK